MIKNLYKKITLSITFNDEKSDDIPLRLGARQDYLTPQCRFNKVLEVLNRTIRPKQTKKIIIQIRKEDVKVASFVHDMALHM